MYSRYEDGEERMDFRETNRHTPPPQPSNVDSIHLPKATDGQIHWQTHPQPSKCSWHLVGIRLTN